MLLYHAIYWNSLAFYCEFLHNEFMLNKSAKNGFTIIELLIVISIISILSVIGISTYYSVQEGARNARRKGDLKDLQKALEAYKARNSRYPSTCSSGVSCALANANWRGNCNRYNGGGAYVNNYIPGLAPTFIAQLPHDPRENKANGSSQNSGCASDETRNCYLYRSTGDEYKLLAHCSPEGTMETTDGFYDPNRATWAWQISSSSISLSW